jgi:hypothetical protein
VTEQARAILLVMAAAVLVFVLLAVVPPGLSGESDPCVAWLDRHDQPHERC